MAMGGRYSSRHRHRIRQWYGELGQQGFVAVGRENAYAVALGHSVGDEGVGEGLCVLVELCESDTPRSVDCGDLVGVNLCGALQEAQRSEWSV